MAYEVTSETLEAWKSLLREGRVQEVDNQIETTRIQIENAAALEAANKPPPEPATLEQLQLAFATEVCARFGNPPRLLALLVEISGRAKKRDD